MIKYEVYTDIDRDLLYEANENIVIHKRKIDETFPDTSGSSLCHSSYFENITAVLFIFPNAEQEKDFNKEMEILLNKCKEKFTNAIFIVAIKDKRKYKVVDDRNVLYEMYEEPFESYADCLLFIKFQLLRYNVNFQYSQHEIFELLKKRCHSPYQFQVEQEKCIFENGKDKLEILTDKNCFYFYQNSEIFLMLTNEHLLSLYDVGLFFEVVDSFLKFGKIFKVLLINDELRFVNSANTSNTIPNYPFIFSKILSFFDQYSHIFSAKKFKIQLAPDNFVVFNRCLKISLSSLAVLLTSADAEKHFLNFIHVSYLYFKCFSKLPICCRMQSLDPEAIVLDSDLFTHYHLQKNSSSYIKICKLLFPYTAQISVDNLKRDYLEILPVNLIQIFHGIKLENFVEMLQKMFHIRISVAPLRNGNFRVGAYLNVCKYFLKSFFLEHYEVSKKLDFKNFLFHLKDCVETKSIYAKFIKSLIPLTICYDYPDPSYKYWMYKKRFIFSKEITDKEKVQEIVTELASFERSEGICLTLINDRIEAIENFNTKVLELALLRQPNDQDSCYYNEEELMKFMQKVRDSPQNSILRKINFQIDYFGMIQFEYCITISPSIFMRIRDTEKLMQAIEKLCQLKVAVPNVISISKLKERNPNISGDLIKIAKCLNPLIENFQNEDFELINFRSLPPVLMGVQRVDFFCKSLIYLRNQKIKVKVNTWVLQTIDTQQTLSTDRRDLLYSELFDENFNFEDFVKLSKNIEQINEDFDGIVSIENNDFKIHDKHRDTEINFFLTEDMIRYVLQMFREINVKHVSIEHNVYFIINRMLTIHAADLLELTKSGFELLIEISEFYYNEKRFDHWITFSNKSHEQLRNEKFVEYIISDENIGLYLDLIRTLTPCLEPIENEELLSYNFLELMPSNLLMKKAFLESLLHIVKTLKNKNHQVYCNYLGIHISSINLHVKMLLRLDNEKRIARLYDFVDYFDKLIPEEEKTTTNPDIQLDGKFSCYRTDTFDFLPIIPEFILIGFNELCDANNNMKDGTMPNLPITIDSKGSNTFLKMAWMFELAMQPEDQDLMRSICGLKNRRQGISLIKIINQSLLNFSDEEICNENLRIFPTSLYVACNSDEKIYEKMITIFEALKRENIRWSLQLNGNICIKLRIIVTINDLLSIYDNLQEKIKSLKKLIDEVEKYENLELVSLYEVKLRSYQKPKLWSTKTLSSKEVISQKNQLLKEQKIEKCRSEPNESFVVNDHLWLKAKLAVKSDVANLSKTIKSVFENTKFQFGSRQERIYTSLLTSSDEQLFEYCQDMCQFVQEEGDISIKYLVDKNMFEFNGILCIHPRSFFHLQDVDDVVAILKKFDQSRKQNPSFLKSNNPVSKEERQFGKELWAIKSRERVEFDVVREVCFTELGKILFKNKANLLGIENIGEVIIDSEKEYFGVEKVLIHGYPIFEGGITNAFVKSKDGALAFEYPENIILEALKFVNEMEPLEDTCKCKNLFDFQSIIEILQAYNSFTKKKDLQGIAFPENFNEFSRNEKMFWWLQKVQEHQINDSWKFKFSNAIKGLHHWFKHDKGFINLEDYYSKMNEFFKTTNYSMELDTQNGDFLNRRYENETFMGSFMVAHDNSGRDDCVATFQKKEKSLTAINFLDEKYLSLASNIIFTDKSFKNFVSENEVNLNNDTAVVYIQNMTLTSLNNYISKTAKFSQKQVLILFFAEIKPKQLKKKKEQQKAAAPDVPGPSGSNAANQDVTLLLNDELIATKKLFSDKNLPTILCYSTKTPSNITETLLASETEMFKVAPMDENMITNNNATELKLFVENCFNNL